METIKAKEVQICIFTPTDMGSVSQYPADEQAIFSAFGEVVTALRNQYGQDVPVYLEFCPLTIPTNQLIAAQFGFSSFPAVQVFAKYANGQTAKYGLSKDLGDKFTGVNWTAADVRPYVEAVLYQREPANPSWLCRIFPPLCSLGGWVWLSAAVFSTYKFSQATEKEKILWGAAAGLTWQSFFAGGGFKKIGL